LWSDSTRGSAFDRDETRLLGLLGEPARSRLLGGAGLELHPQQQPGEAEASVAACPGGAVAVDRQPCVGEAGTGIMEMVVAIGGKRLMRPRLRAATGFVRR
jgi:hypothetical protein